MPTRGSWLTMKFRTVVDVVRVSRFQSSYGGLKRNSPIVSAARVERRYWMYPRMQLFSTNSNKSTNANSCGVKNAKVQPEGPASTMFTFPSWLRWVLGSVLSLVLPFWKYWQKFQMIEEEAEVVVEEVEEVAKVVEKVAMVAEKVSEDVAEMFPKDSNLHNAALVLERASEHAAHGAQQTEEFIHKVEELKNDLDGLESFVEPVIEKIVKKQHGKN
ncbi:uncharacterized protein LOC130716254 [Lotus japonicus]|uniref:uncharacterized protein LOC130716254 n=1 Tax=Lotus japonicus TaxID=34305 RepID=UPI0025871CB0|nr:uncharacterized protein LOC130716254 [Lotus japonicus]